MYIHAHINHMCTCAQTMYVCMRTHMHTHVCECTQALIHMCIHGTCTHMCIYLRTCVYMCTHTRCIYTYGLCAPVHACTHIHAYTCTYMRARACTHAHTYTHKIYICAHISAHTYGLSYNYKVYINYNYIISACNIINMSYATIYAEIIANKLQIYLCIYSYIRCK